MKRFFVLALLLAVPVPSLHAQQWSGDTTSTGLIYRSGSVGIGFTNPSVPLDVNGSIRASGGVNVHIDRPYQSEWITAYPIGLSSTGSEREGEWDWFYDASTVFTIRHPSSHQRSAQMLLTYHDRFFIRKPNYDGSWRDWVQVLTADNQGRVGIGTFSPQAKLDIESSGQTTLRVAGNGGASSWRARLLLDRIDDYRGAGMWITASAGVENDWYAGVPYTGNGFTIGYGTTEPEYREQSKLFIASNGNVGIGTTTPSDKLTLVSSSGATFGVDGDVNGNVYLRGSGEFRLRPDGSTVNKIMLSADESYFNGGNVGIGTTDPPSKLAVNGTITSKEIIVTEATETWPDYVFDDNYPLRSLHEVQSFIEQHGHLPEVPSAGDVEANGVAVGAMQATLLQKIEELTLYLLEQDQAFQHQHALNQAQMQQLQLLKQENAALGRRLAALESASN